MNAFHADIQRFYALGKKASMPEEFTKLVAIDIATYSEIAKAAGIKVD